MQDVQAKRRRTDSPSATQPDASETQPAASETQPQMETQLESIQGRNSAAGRGCVSWLTTAALRAIVVSFKVNQRPFTMRIKMVKSVNDM